MDEEAPLERVLAYATRGLLESVDNLKEYDKIESRIHAQKPVRFTHLLDDRILGLFLPGNVCAKLAGLEKRVISACSVAMRRMRYRFSVKRLTCDALVDELGPVGERQRKGRRVEVHHAGVGPLWIRAVVLPARIAGNVFFAAGAPI